MNELEPCCRTEAENTLRRHRDVAVCDDCGQLLLAYGNNADYEATLQELGDHAVSFQAGTLSLPAKLLVISKER